MAKYNCRQCPKATRDRCIAQIPSSVLKKMVERAFEARTDTEAMWKILQADCLRIREEQEAKIHHESALARRLRLAKGEEEAAQLEPEEAETIEPETEPVPVSVIIGSVETIQPEIREVDQVGVKAPPPPAVEKLPEWQEEPEVGLSFFLTLEPGERQIALLTEGEIILGRPDPNIGFSPDIDLTYEDKDWLTISRRHAKIYCEGDVHYIEDLGSTNGTIVNTQLLEPGQKHRLRQGDRIVLGDYLFVYGYAAK